MKIRKKRADIGEIENKQQKKITISTRWSFEKN